MKKYFLIFTLFLFVGTLFGQSIERERPAKWQNLVKGAQFIDRFLPMPEGTLSSDSWGNEKVKPRFVDNGIEDETYSYWGGNILKDADGLYHIYPCRWLESSARGHNEWPNSEVVHATSDNLYGPYTVQAVIGKGHNPEARVLEDGSIAIYAMILHHTFVDYISAGYSGPWKSVKQERNARGRKIQDGFSNQTFAKRSKGSYLMMCRGGSIWAPGKNGEWNQISYHSAYPINEGSRDKTFEDPVFWRDRVQYHAIVNDWLGRIAYYMRSPNGVDWTIDDGSAYEIDMARHDNGHIEQWYKYERMKIFQDEELRAISANYAVIDTVKNQDKASDNHSSKNIIIPLQKDRLINIIKLDETNDTISIEIQKEANMPEINLASLQFGAPTLVDYGKGAKALSHSENETSIVINFKLSDCGFTDNDFVGKLLGKHNDETIAFGFARLPNYDFTQFILSAEKLKVRKTMKAIHFEFDVTNFGEEASGKRTLTIIASKNGQTINWEYSLSSLAPLESKKVHFSFDNPPKGLGWKYSIVVNGQKTPVVLK